MVQADITVNPKSDASSAIVFVVEDDHDYRMSLEMVIAAAGYRVQTYASADALIDRYTPDQPGCLVLDLHTPTHDALQLYEALVQLGGFHPFIVISALGSIPKVAQVMRGGAIDFLTKPVDHSLLVQRIAEAIKTDAQRRVTQGQRSAIQAKLNTLTKREFEVLQHVSKGLVSKQIAKRLGIEHKTVDVHRSNIMKKMNVDSFVELATQLASHALI